MEDRVEDRMYALKIAYCGLVQLSRRLTEEDLKRVTILDECSTHVGRVAAGALLNSQGQPRQPRAAHPSTWKGREAFESGLGPWRHMEPAAALPVCQSLLKRASHDPLTVCHGSEGRPDWSGTYHLEGVNAGSLRVLDRALWRFSRHPGAHAYALPPFMAGTAAASVVGAQQVWLRTVRSPIRLMWNACHPLQGCLVVTGGPGEAAVVMAFHTMSEALKNLTNRLEISRDELIARAVDAEGFPVSSFAALVEEALASVVVVQWERVLVEEIRREVVA